MLAAIAWGSFHRAGLTFAVPRVEVIFADFGIPLPLVPRMIITTSHLIFRLAPVIPLLFAALLAGDWFVLEAFGKRGEIGASRVWSRLVLITPLLMLGVISFHFPGLETARLRQPHA